MKYFNYLLLAICLGLIVFLSLFLMSNKETDVAPGKKQMDVSSVTVSLLAPDQVEFCEKKIKLDRYDMIERYDRELNIFTYHHSSTMLLIKRANRYFPMIEPILKKNGIPDDFKYLATIESNLDIRAVSPAKAVGLWQITADPGKKYGLEINEQIDERYHIEKATQAACDYFKEAYSRYGNWVDVAASYNAGMGRISNELANQQANSAFDLLLVEESARYIFRIIAAKEVFSNPYKYGFVLKRENLYPLIPVKQVEVNEDIPDFTVFAQKHNLTYAQLKDFNPWLRDRKLKIISGKKYSIAIPDKEDLYYDRNKTKVHSKAWVED